MERIIDIFIKESSRYFESELDIEIFGQLFQAIAIMLLKEKRGTEDLVTDLSKIVFKEESGRVSKKMINHARSWLYLSHVIGYCSKSINCDHLSIVDNCRYYYMDLGVAALFSEKDRRTRYSYKRNSMRKLCVFGTFESVEEHRQHCRNRAMVCRIPADGWSTGFLCQKSAGL